ncbi:MAG: phytoene desaturase [Chitinophagaceae bacterium]|nr:phytoene desaturase [Chitinophagaceae bacterium]MCW5929433.1 phytoene desaturase [Chitinophagaceae bacterium]
MSTPKAIVTGSGIAGIAAAIRLAIQGYSVTVYEKNSYPGGKISLVEKDGYRFDSGPSLFTEPWLIEELFWLADEPMESYFSYEPVPNSCRYFFTNGKIVDAWTDREKLLQEFEQQLGEPREVLSSYLEKAGKIYENIGEVFFDRPMYRSAWLNKKILKAVASFRPGLVYYTLNEFNEQQLTTGEAIQIFNRYATYNGSSPYSAPAMLSMISAIELDTGVFYPAGGMISIANALYELAVKKGVRFEFNRNVSRIIHTGSQTKGVVLDGKNIFSDIVVSDADVYFTYRDLLDRKREAAALTRKEPGSSAVIFYWGIKKEFPQLQLHNVLFSAEYKAEFNHIFTLKKTYKDPTVYINITSKMEEGHAPPGKENWFVMINVPAIGTSAEWEKEIPYIRQQVLKKLRGMLKEDVEPLIETEQVSHPGILERDTNSFRGAIYGMSSNTRRGAFRRHPNSVSGLPGVYFCGGTVHPGGGIPLCLKSAEIVGTLVKKRTADH